MSVQEMHVRCAVLRYVSYAKFSLILKFLRTSVASPDPQTVCMFTGACGPPEKLSLALVLRSNVLRMTVELAYWLVGSSFDRWSALATFCRRWWAWFIHTRVCLVSVRDLLRVPYHLLLLHMLQCVVSQHCAVQTYPTWSGFLTSLICG